jgi:hypothetical protein
MDGSEVVAAVREAAGTELDRLGGEKALVAATDAHLDRETVFRAAAATEARARETFREWAEDEQHDAAAGAFDAAAATERDHHERVVAELDGDPGSPDVDALHGYLRGLDETPERVGGLLGRSLASERSLLQFVNFFVNEGDRATADLFRDLRSDTDALVDESAALLDEVCDDEADFDRARAAAIDAVQAAYEVYETSLQDLGVDPKPVC